MFRGRHAHTIDEKGRVSIPSKYREVLNGRGQHTLIISNDLDTCLAVFPMDEWLEEERKIKSLPDFIPEALRYKRFYISGAQECPIDRQGRILIPPALREYAQLHREALFVGLIEKFEIWSPDLWKPRPENPDEIRRALQQYL
jgi:MraZ protein